MTLEQLQIFVKVVQAGSFTRAADALGLQKSRVSRVLSQLEAGLRIRLLERSTRRLSLTEAGREVHERALGILAAVDDTARMAEQARAAPQGELRLTCGVEIGLLAAGRWIEAYLAQHPGMRIEADYTGRVVDLVHEGFDVAIRVGPLEPSRLVARALGSIDYGLFASPGYLRRHPPPAHPDALGGHALIGFAGPATRQGWELEPVAGGAPLRVKAPLRLRVNNSFAVRDAVLADLGIGRLPLIVAHEAVAAGRLQRVLAPWRIAPVPVHAVYPSSRYLLPKLRAFVDLAAAAFPAACDAARAACDAAAAG